MSEKEKHEIRVLVRGKLVPLEELKKEYADIMIAGAPGSVRVIEILAATDKPLNTVDLAKKTSLSTGYVRDVLKKLMKNDLVLKFQLGRGRNLYYLLTEKGFNFYKKLKGEAK